MTTGRPTRAAWEGALLHDSLARLEEAQRRLDEEDVLLDSYLSSLSLARKHTPKDGACLFRAVAEHVYHTQALHNVVREECVEYLQTHHKDFAAFVCVNGRPYDDYLNKMRKPTTWGGEVELQALSNHYRVNFEIYQLGEQVMKIDNGFKKTYQLCFSHGNHYDIVYPQSTMNALSLCQSLVYEIINHVLAAHENEKTSLFIPPTFRNVELECWIEEARRREMEDIALAQMLEATGNDESAAELEDAQAGEFQLVGRGRKNRPNVAPTNRNFPALKATTVPSQNTEPKQALPERKGPSHVEMVFRSVADEKSPWVLKRQEEERKRQQEKEQQHEHEQAPDASPVSSSVVESTGPDDALRETRKTKRTPRDLGRADTRNRRDPERQSSRKPTSGAASPVDSSTKVTQSTEPATKSSLRVVNSASPSKADSDETSSRQSPMAGDGLPSLSTRASSATQSTPLSWASLLKRDVTAKSPSASTQDIIPMLPVEQQAQRTSPPNPNPANGQRLEAERTETDQITHTPLPSASVPSASPRIRSPDESSTPICEGHDVASGIKYSPSLPTYLENEPSSNDAPSGDGAEALLFSFGAFQPRTNSIPTKAEETTKSRRIIIEGVDIDAEDLAQLDITFGEFNSATATVVRQAVSDQVGAPALRPLDYSSMSTDVTRTGLKEELDASVEEGTGSSSNGNGMTKKGSKEPATQQPALAARSTKKHSGSSAHTGRHPGGSKTTPSTRQLTTSAPAQDRYNKRSSKTNSSSPGHTGSPPILQAQPHGGNINYYYNYAAPYGHPPYPHSSTFLHHSYPTPPYPFPHHHHHGVPTFPADYPAYYSPEFSAPTPYEYQSYGGVNYAPYGGAAAPYSPVDHGTLLLAATPIGHSHLLQHAQPEGGEESYTDEYNGVAPHDTFVSEVPDYGHYAPPGHHHPLSTDHYAEFAAEPP